ncbi:YkgJ family cysteine cluster protein [Biformimicrobium ophioploci]|uniref:YkgJ family cysteine cluster protein n=1 Tax=Biformimicrobium ophioploci TaxID=3036711 RepID=A0ABQ6LZ92_9GAMM|nr:YkgJ family cysteine cluster protein [Microbulbifer sp. NKW57]GMG87357.1 YkgJ family cysteine cluster protein [Microbulbifer sp. NKW57]
MECRLGCGACCIAPSINNPIPGMPNGKPAGVRCVNLDDDNLCRLFGKPERPALCAAFQPCESVCGDSRIEALALISAMEIDTRC